MSLETFKYAVTFESTTKAPETVRGEVTATDASTATARAVRDARKRLRETGKTRLFWSSLSVLLERTGEAEENNEATEEP